MHLSIYLNECIDKKISKEIIDYCLERFLNVEWFHRKINDNYLRVNI